MAIFTISSYCDFYIQPNIAYVPSHPTLICCDFLDAYSGGCVIFTSEQCFQTYVFSINCDSKKVGCSFELNNIYIVDISYSCMYNDDCYIQKVFLANIVVCLRNINFVFRFEIIKIFINVCFPLRITFSRNEVKTLVYMTTSCTTKGDDLYDTII